MTTPGSVDLSSCLQLKVHLTPVWNPISFKSTIVSEHIF